MTRMSRQVPQCGGTNTRRGALARGPAPCPHDGPCYPAAVRSLLLTVMLAGCGGGDYELEILFETPELAAAASVVYVWLVEQCPPAAELHVPPARPLESAVVRPGLPAAALGGAREGYGVHALARSDSCAVFAAGCETVSQRSGDDGTIVVTLAERSEGTQCQDAEVCDQGLCWPQGSCAPIGSGCGATPCCTGTCALETAECVEIPEDR